MVSADKVKTFVNQEFKKLGVNKRNEISRLLYDISRREDCSLESIFNEGAKGGLQFDQFKTYLLKRRYPQTTAEHNNPRFYFPELDFNPEYKVTIKKEEIVLKNIFIERAAEQSSLAKNLRERYPKAHFETIPSYKKYTHSHPFNLKDYNRRMDSFFIIHEKYDFFKQCPCSFKSLFCGYHVVNLGSGCAFECAYCYLQDYLNSPGIVLPGNLEDFFEHFKNYKQDIRVGSGELTDSLVFDHITEYSPQIVDFFKNYPKSSFEFKTKSNNINLLRTVKPAGNIIISWTMNPQKIIETVEHLTASLNERIEAARECAELGYKIVFHFDPIIYFQGWEEAYRELIDRIFTQVPQSSIGLVSLGTLRMTNSLRKIIENRFPETEILNEELFIGHDGKLRYPDRLRVKLYSSLKKWIQEYHPELPIYLCMEEKGMCEDTQSGPMKKYRSEVYK